MAEWRSQFFAGLNPADWGCVHACMSGSNRVATGGEGPRRSEADGRSRLDTLRTCRSGARGETCAEPNTPVEQTSNDALLKKLQAMEQRIKSLEGQIKQKAAPVRPGPQASAAVASAARPPGKPDKLSDAADAAPAAQSAGRSDAAKTENKAILGLADSPVTGLSIGAYGEVIRRHAEPGRAANGRTAFDARRLVLLPTYPITDNIIFNAEIEFEHAGSGFDNDDKLHGTAEIEQIWIDFKIMDQFNWRAPGIDLVPIGYINQHHEPTQFYSVYRPELYNGLIPSTWKVPATSVYGTITDGLKYKSCSARSLEDFGDEFVRPHRRQHGAAVPGRRYVPGIDGMNALGFPTRRSATSASSTTTWRSPAGSTSRRRPCPASPAASAPITRPTRRRAAPMPTWATFSADRACHVRRRISLPRPEHRLGVARRSTST